MIAYLLFIFVIVLAVFVAPVSVWLYIRVSKLSIGTRNSNLSSLMKRVWQLTDPNSEVNFYTTYFSILVDAARIASSKTLAAIVSLAPVGLSYLIAQWLGYPQLFIWIASLSSLIAIVWFRQRSVPDGIGEATKLL